MRALWIALLALALAVLAVGLMPDSPARRTARLDLSASGFRETFLAFSRSQPDRCRVVDRRDSTLRRTDERAPGRNWDCLRIPPGASLAETEAFLAQSKKKGRGTVFFVRADRVPDWSYPYFHAYVRAERPDLDLPSVEWTQLYVDRVYRGLHLRVALPFDLRRKDAGSGTLRELLVMHAGTAGVLDTRFEESAVLLARRGGEVGAPEAGAPPELLWLAALAPPEAVAVLVSNEPPYPVSLLPLPVSLASLHLRLRGRPLTAVGDGPIVAWLGAVIGRDAAPTSPHDPEALAALQSGFTSYAHALDRALRDSAALDRSLDRLRAIQPERQAAANALGLRFEAL